MAIGFASLWPEVLHHFGQRFRSTLAKGFFGVAALPEVCVFFGAKFRFSRVFFRPFISYSTADLLSSWALFLFWPWVVSLASQRRNVKQIS